MNTLKKGFTLLEILLVVAAIGILAGITILALNPTKQLGDTRNAQRRSDVNTILNAVYQYSLDNNGNLPTTISATAGPICKTAATCTTEIDLSVLTTNEKYLISIPVDPSVSSTTSTGYTIQKTVNNRVVVAAPSAEQGQTIQAKR